MSRSLKMLGRSHNYWAMLKLGPLFYDWAQPKCYAKTNIKRKVDCLCHHHLSRIHGFFSRVSSAAKNIGWHKNRMKRFAGILNIQILTHNCASTPTAVGASHLFSTVSIKLNLDPVALLWFRFFYSYGCSWAHKKTLLAFKATRSQLWEESCDLWII